MTLAVIGSRTFKDRTWLFRELDALLKDLGPFRVITGGAKGADTFAEEWCREMMIPCQVLRPDYQHHAAGAEMRRNEAMVTVASRVIAWWDGSSRGTAATVRMARKRGVPVTVHVFDRRAGTRIERPQEEQGTLPL